MPLLDTEVFDFSGDLTTSGEEPSRRVAVVRNTEADAALHVIALTKAPWLDVYPTEFALAPHEAQSLVVEMRPTGTRQGTLAPTVIDLHGQYLYTEPREIKAQIQVIPPSATCPTCSAELAEGARECRKCGERIRLCPVCAAPNTWIARVCRRSASHVLRTGTDWRMSPGGVSAHTLASDAILGSHLGRVWSAPTYPVARAELAAEWCAPLAAFGMVIGSAIETAQSRATIQAFALTNGESLWDFDLPGTTGIYPDRGGMALSEEGLLYAATLDGSVVALDAIRGTRRWGTEVTGAVYGGLTVADQNLLVPAGESVVVLDRLTGDQLHVLPVGGRVDSAPGYTDGTVFVTCDNSSVSAFDAGTGQLLWNTPTDGSFDTSPVLHSKFLYCATMSGTVYALDSLSGAVLWNTSVSSRPIAATPALSADGLLFVAANDGFVHIIAAETGNLVRSRRVSSAPLRTGAVCSGHTVFVGADDGNIYSLDADYTVRRVYETTPGARLSTAGPALCGDTLVAAATNGVLYVLKAQNL